MKYPSVLSTILSSDDLYNHYCKLIDKTKDETLRNGLGTALGVYNSVKDRDVKSFVVSESLNSALDTVDCEEVGPWHFGGAKAYNFLLNRNSLYDSEHKYNEMFVLILPPGETVYPFKNFDPDFHKISIYFCDNTKMDSAMPSVFVGAKFKDGSTFEEIVRSADAQIGDGNIIDNDIKIRAIKLALNLILYVHSPDPDIMRLKPQVYNTKSFRENYFKKCKDESHLLGIYSLGWDFHGREYSVHIGTRKGHFKWQPCGKLWSQRKLIFVKATTVNYGKENPNEDSRAN